MIRESSRWREASWKEALDRSGEGLACMRALRGRDAVRNPVAHNVGLMTRAVPFAHMLRACNVYQSAPAPSQPPILFSSELT